MRISATTSTPDAYRQSQFYAGTHLVHYQVASRVNDAKQSSNVSFQQRLQKVLNGSHASKTPSLKEREFLKLRDEYADREEAMQRLIYQNGVNFSTEQQLALLERLS